MEKLYKLLERWEDRNEDHEELQQELNDFLSSIHGIQYDITYFTACSCPGNYVVVLFVAIVEDGKLKTYYASQGGN